MYGIGAVVRFTTGDGDSDSDSDSGSDSDSDSESTGGRSVLRPVIGGASYASQDSLTGTFGLGSASRGQIDVLWPGGVRNRLDDVDGGEAVLFPEIPCGYDANWPSSGAYQSCVEDALDELVAAGIIGPSDRSRFLSSAIRAFDEAH